MPAPLLLLLILLLSLILPLLLLIPIFPPPASYLDLCPAILQNYLAESRLKMSVQSHWIASQSGVPIGTTICTTKGWPNIHNTQSTSVSIITSTLTPIGFRSNWPNVRFGQLEQSHSDLQTRSTQYARECLLWKRATKLHCRWRSTKISTNQQKSIARSSCGLFPLVSCGLHETKAFGQAIVGHGAKHLAPMVDSSSPALT